MKDWSSHPAAAPRLKRRRIPAFHPVPVSPRKDGWTPMRQAEFIGYLAQYRCVEQAARAVSMGKESAYRLRRRPGAAGFAAAWDAAMGRGLVDGRPGVRPVEYVDRASTKSTDLPLHYRAQAGLVQVMLKNGRYVGSRWKDDISAILRLAHRLRNAGEGGR